MIPNYMGIKITYYIMECQQGCERCSHVLVRFHQWCRFSRQDDEKKETTRRSSHRFRSSHRVWIEVDCTILQTSSRHPGSFDVSDGMGRRRKRRLTNGRSLNKFHKKNTAAANRTHDVSNLWMIFNHKE